MSRLFNGFLVMVVGASLIIAVLAVFMGLAWMITNETWLNLIWALPLFLGACWAMGGEIE